MTASILVYISSDPDNALGENIIKLPFLRALRTAFPGARIAWVPGLGPAKFAGPLAPLVEGQIDELICDLDLPRRWPAALGWRSPLPGRRFDLVIDTQHLPQRTLQLRRIAHRRFISPAWRFALSHGRPPGGAWPVRLVDRLLALVAAATGGPLPAPGHRAPLAPHWHARAAALLPPGATYVGLAPGAGRRDTGKCWPLERYLALAREQAARGRTVVWLAGPDEREWADALAAVPGSLLPALDSPALTVALAGRLAGAVANCSGTGHMLAAGGAPLVSLFGPTDPAKYAPYAVAGTAIRGEGRRIDAITPEMVADALEKHLARANPPHP
ncbi:MAG: glycosyltransferase family 9 protein [Thalassobaculales bacterium]